MILRRAWKPSLNVCLFLSHLWLLDERPSWWDCGLGPMGMPSSWRLEIRDEGQIQGQIFHPIIRLRILTPSWEIENSQTSKNRLMTSSGYIIEWPWSTCFWKSKWSCLCQTRAAACCIVQYTRTTLMSGHPRPLILKLIHLHDDHDSLLFALCWWCQWESCNRT